MIAAALVLGSAAIVIRMAGPAAGAATVFGGLPAQERLKTGSGLPIMPRSGRFHHERYSRAVGNMSSQTPEEVRWAQAIEQSTFGVWDLDPRLDRVHYSPQWKARIGFPRIHAPDSSAFWRCRVHPDDFKAMFEALRANLDGDAATYETTFRLRSNGHGYRTMLSRGRVVARDRLGNGARMVGTMVDLNGTPPPLTHCGLATEGPDDLPETWACQPFHAVLGASGQGGEPRPGAGAADSLPLADLVSDLLDEALRHAAAAG